MTWDGSLFEELRDVAEGTGAPDPALEDLASRMAVGEWPIGFHRASLDDAIGSWVATGEQWLWVSDDLTSDASHPWSGVTAVTAAASPGGFELALTSTARGRAALLVADDEPAVRRTEWVTRQLAGIAGTPDRTCPTCGYDATAGTVCPWCSRSFLGLAGRPGGLISGRVRRDDASGAFLTAAGYVDQWLAGTGNVWVTCAARIGTLPILLVVSGGWITAWAPDGSCVRCLSRAGATASPARAGTAEWAVTVGDTAGGSVTFSGLPAPGVAADIAARVEYPADDVHPA